MKAPPLDTLACFPADPRPLMIAWLSVAENAAAARRGQVRRFASSHDAFAIVGAINELVSRQVRLGEPAEVLELAPVIDRLIAGLS